MSTNYEKGFNNLPNLKNHPAGDYMGGDWPTKFNIIFDDFTSFDTASNGWRVGTNAGSTVALAPTSQFDSKTANGVLRMTQSSSTASTNGSCVLAWSGGNATNTETIEFTGNEPFFWQVRYKYGATCTDASFGFSMSEDGVMASSKYNGIEFLHPGFQCQFNPQIGTGNDPSGSWFKTNTAIVGAFGHWDGKDDATVIDRFNVLTFYYDPKREFMVYQINDRRYESKSSGGFQDGMDFQIDSVPSSQPTGKILLPSIGFSAGTSQFIDIDYVMVGCQRPEELF
tara:strand:+ start:1062 stop:1910 length:849 start_codon:yes stop_codon:yes gene_type:complete